MLTEEKDIDIIRTTDDKRKRVRMTNEDCGFHMMTMKNGFQWAGAPVDRDVLLMMRDVIDQYFEENPKDE